MVLQVQLLDSLLNHTTDLVGSDALDQSIELDSLLDSELREDCIILRAVADKLSGVLELFLDIVALNSDLTSCWSDLSGQTLESGRLAGTIDTEQGKALTVVKTE